MGLPHENHLRKLGCDSPQLHPSTPPLHPAGQPMMLLPRCLPFQWANTSADRLSERARCGNREIVRKNLNFTWNMWISRGKIGFHLKHDLTVKNGEFPLRSLRFSAQNAWDLLSKNSGSSPQLAVRIEPLKSAKGKIRPRMGIDHQQNLGISWDIKVKHGKRTMW